MQKAQLRPPGHIGCGRARGYGIFKKRFGENGVELVVAQVAGNGHHFQAGHALADGQGALIERDIQRQRRAVAPFLQCVALHHFVGQHGQLVAGHVNGGQAGAAQQVDGAARQHGQAGRSDMNAERDRAAAQALDRQRVVNLCGAGVVDRKSPYIGQRQFLLSDGRLQDREGRALGKVLKQKALPVKLVSRCDGACALQQVQRLQVRSPCGFHHRFVFGAIFVWLEKNLVQLLAHRRRALALGQFFGPGADLGDQEFFLFNAGQRQLQNLGGCLFEAAFTGAPEIMRRLKQPEQSSRLLLQAGGLAGVGAEVVARQVGKTEFLVAGKFPGQVQVNLQAQ